MKTHTSNPTWQAFKQHKRGWFALRVLAVLFAIALLAPLWSNDKPLWIRYQGEYYFPLVNEYNETVFGGDFDTPADYLDPLIRGNITSNGNYAVYLPNPYDADTLNDFDTQPDPASPSERHLLGTDDRGRDVLARLVYGFRDSLLFALALTLVTTVIGVITGAVQGYFGGKTDLLMQRFIEIWGGMPELYLLIILSSFFNPSLLILLALLSLFGWMGLSDYVRAEFLKNRQADYVLAARSRGQPSDYVAAHPAQQPDARIGVSAFPHLRRGACADQLGFSRFGRSRVAGEFGRTLGTGQGQLGRLVDRLVHRRYADGYAAFAGDDRRGFASGV